MKRRGQLVLAIPAALLTASLLWIGGEMHYRNCLQSAELHHPVRYVAAREPGIGGPNPYLSIPAHFTGREERNEAISTCSRWP